MRSEIGYAAVFLLVTAQTAGVPVPGMTALIVTGVLASRGHLALAGVAAAGAAGTTVGGHVGYLIGGRGLRWLLTRRGRLARGRQRFVTYGEGFFARHGARAVFAARWIPGLRVWGAWFAGASKMPPSTFAFWNAVGGVAWAGSVAGAAYVLGSAAGSAFGALGVGFSALLAVAIVVHVLRWRRNVRYGRRASSGRH